MKKIIFHIDVNSAYLSWEAVRQLKEGAVLDLRTVPSAVGGDEQKRHGIVLAKSIPAKRFGVRTGESLLEARTKCPQLLVVPPDYTLFMQSSQNMMTLLSDYSPFLQRYSIDEVFLQYFGKKGGHLEQAEEIRKRIKKDFGFTVNIGVSVNKLLAKMASDFEKPDRVHTLFPEEIREKMWPLDVGKLFYVGPRTKKKLNDRRIYTIGDLAALDEDFMYRWLKTPGRTIWRFAHGIADDDLSSTAPVKSIGNSSTLPYDVLSYEDVERVFLAIAETVSMRLRAASLCGKVLTVHYRNANLITRHKQKRYDFPTVTTGQTFRRSMELFDELWQRDPIRSAGITVSDLQSNEFLQLCLFSESVEKEIRLDGAIDKIRRKYGKKSVYRAVFQDSEIPALLGGVLTGEDYPMMKSEL